MKERPKQGRHKSTDQLGITYHYLDGVLHREDGPSIESQDGYREWWFNGERHREDGPACEWANGTKKWFLKGIQYTEEEFNQWLIKKNLNEKLHSTLEPRPKGKKNKI